MRQDPAGGKVAWCTLELPPQQVAETDPSPAEAAGRPGFELVWSKLRPPALRAGLVPRAGLLSLLQQGVQARLCSWTRPPGSARPPCSASGGWRPVAAGSPGSRSTRRTTIRPACGSMWRRPCGRSSRRWGRPRRGAAAPQRRPRPGGRAVAAQRPACRRRAAVPGPGRLPPRHQPGLPPDTRLLPDHLPAGVHVRWLREPTRRSPWPGCGPEGSWSSSVWRSCGSRTRRRRRALNAPRACGLPPMTWSASWNGPRAGRPGWSWPACRFATGRTRRVHRLVPRRQPPCRRLPGAEVLDRQPEEIRSFLLRTSVRPAVRAAVRRRPGDRGLHRAAGRAGAVQTCSWCRWMIAARYRYHHLFRELLRLELGQREPGLVPVLHRRAAAWHGTAGQLDEAIGHASAAGDFAEAGALIARHLVHPLGRWTTSDRGPLAGRARGGDHGQSAGGLRRRLDPWAGGAPGRTPNAGWPRPRTAATRGRRPTASPRWPSAPPRPGHHGVRRRGRRSPAYRALEVAGPAPTPFSWTAQAALGHCLYLAGRRPRHGRGSRS